MGKIIRIKIYLSIIVNIWVLMMVCQTSDAQDLCNASSNPNYISDGFELLTPAVGCGPLTVKIEDKTGYSDIKYIYYYGGQDRAGLDTLGAVTSLENTYFTPPQTSNYTILQYGKDSNGDDFYSCENVTVRVNNSPRFSYTLCNSSELTIDIPNSISNDFDYYEIDWGSGTSENVPKADLPYSKKKSVVLPVNINVEGFYNGITLNCGTPATVTLTSPTPAGIDLEFHPNIDKIELNTATSGTISFNGALSTTGYEIYKTEKNAPYITTPYLTNQQPGEIPFEIEDSTKSYCFYAIRNISCGIEQSAEICTVPLFGANFTEQENVLNWAEYKTRQFDWPNQPQYGRFLESNTSIIIKENGASLAEVTLPNSPPEFYHTINCANEYCYRVKVETSGQLFRFQYQGESLSNERCISRKDFKPDSINTLFVTVINDSPTIAFTDDSGWLLDKEMYYLFNGSTLLDSINPSESPFQTTLDASSESKCFQIQYQDECGSRSKLSPEVCSIFLQTDGSSGLYWQESFPFSPGSIAAYEILAIDEINPNFRTSVFTATNFVNGSHQPNLENNESEASYVIRAVTSSGQESYSNIASIPIKTDFYFPAAFSPKSSILENQYFRIFGKLSSLTSFKIKIYSRWGRLVFFSEDPFFTWDGTYKGNTLPSGSYSFNINARNYRGEMFSRSGLINIIN